MPPSEAPESNHMVAEAVGPPLPLGQAMAAMAMGVFALLVAGVIPVLLGGLVDEHRLSAAGLGLCATFEGLSMGIFTALIGAVLPAERLRPIGAVAALVLVALDIATTHVSGTGVIVVRAAAGLPEGVLLWITIGMIARSETPERLAGIFLAAITAAQFVIAVGFTAYVLPRFGSEGGFFALALATLPAVVIAFFGPPSYAALVKPVGESGAPPLRGWAALAAVVVFTASIGAVGIYLQPLAQEAGLDAGVARLALTLSLFAQVIGGSVAAMIAGRVHYMLVFSLGSAVYLGCWAVMGMHAPAWAFIAVNVIAGFTFLLMTPFLVPMMIEADPSRRAAVMGGGAQVVAGALGPFAASFVVSDANVHGAIFLGVGLLIAGLAMMAGMHLVAARERAHRRLAVIEPAE